MCCKGTSKACICYSLLRKPLDDALQTEAQTLYALLPLAPSIRLRVANGGPNPVLVTLSLSLSRSIN